MPSIRPILYAVLVLFTIITAAVFYFATIEGKSGMEALWLTMSSVTTTGYSDVMPSTSAGRIITMFLSVLGFGFLTYVLSTTLTGMVEGRISDIWGKRKMIKQITRLKDHIIVCGAGRVGKEVIRELIRKKKEFVVIEKEPSILEDIRAEGNVLFIAGDATEDRILQMAGVAYAKGIITTIPDDAGNLMITISCKDFNPEAHIVARATRPESVIRLKRAGADTVVSPSAIAGSRMALASLKPASVAVVETLIDDHENNLNLEELLITYKSKLVGMRLKDSRIRDDYGIMVLAIMREGQNIINPEPSEVFKVGDILVLFGAAEQLYLLEKVVAGE
ncbi:potassium channel family protein [Pelotomaculum propionicicum]|uniref:Voltage-gated potassium channel Kch n=1 Tax=Pelotomaculum propionicicum TaxID=258475 RepID=A0A4Y7RQ31_9FIRM|nr:potassium channel protein [Pelotomaculum propionicicum]TEB10953.1 Voltage-gated potassium channel Kch [Pelotomaculum propionicicum]